MKKEYNFSKGVRGKFYRKFMAEKESIVIQAA